MTSTRSKAKQSDGSDEAAPWETPTVEGDPSIGAGQQVEPADTVEGVPVLSGMETLMEWCVAFEEANQADSAAVMEAEVRRILAADNMEEALAESAPLNGKDHTDKPFLLRSFRLIPTDYSEGWPFYAAMDCEAPGRGESFVLNCGGIKVVAALKVLNDLDEYPYAIKIRGKQTRSGNTVLSIVMPSA